MIITVHKCRTNSFTYYKKESKKICELCRYSNSVDLELEETTVDAVNDRVFKRHRYELEVENDVESFFNPSENIIVIDNSLKNKPEKYVQSKVGLFTKVIKPKENKSLY